MDDAQPYLQALGIAENDSTNGILNGTNGLNGHGSPSYETKLLILSAKDEQTCKNIVSNLKEFLVE
jgi:hypothetical protein